MKTYVVTGGAGFIGSNLAERLIRRGEKVYVLDDLSTGFLRNIPAGAVFHKVDISSSDDLANLDIPNKIDVVYHMAGQSSGEASFDDPVHDIRANYLATYNILKYAKRRHCERFFYASSMSVYGEVNADDVSINEEHPCNPASYYGCNKLASEKLIRIFVKNANIKPTVLRFFNVYGPGQNMANMKQGMASIYMSYLMNDQPVVVKGSLDRFRDFIYVDDLVDALLKIETNTATYGEVYNVGTGRQTTVETLLKAMLKAFGKRDFDHWIKVQGSTPGDIKGFTADISKIRSAVEWTPRWKVEEGIASMKSWIDRTKDTWKE